MRPAVQRRTDLVVLQRRTRTQEEVFGTTVSDGWADAMTVFGEVKDILAGQTERYGDTIDIARRPCRITMLFREDITGDMRVIARGRAMEIVRGPAEIGRREGLELICEDYSTQGERA